ncbi:MAG: heme biosynthesis HemY N-terminal domain-containing protein, partial [Gammaproteobacteria bacterium]|nr:heme biosynthesis HemY N-terminal domain-containing protein [Gammaproteobacteria bacterium]
MRLIKRLLLLLVVAAAVYLGYFIKQQGSGFVLIQYQEFSIETSVFVFSGLIIVLFIFVYVLLRSVSNLIKIPDFVNRSYTNYQNKKSSVGLISGLTEFTEGRFKKAESILIKQASGNESSFLNYLLAARAAQLLHADDRRDT